jgi:hypothetical protein
MASSGMLRRVALVITDVSEELSAFIIRGTRIGELALFLVHRFLSPWLWRRYVPPKRRFLQEPHVVTSHNTTFFIVTAVTTSNLTRDLLLLLLLNYYYYYYFRYGVSENVSICMLVNAEVSSNKIQIPWPLVHEWTIPTERPPQRINVSLTEVWPNISAEGCHP